MIHHRKFYVHTSADPHDAYNWWLYAPAWLFQGTKMDKYELSEKEDLPDYWFIKDYFMTVYAGELPYAYYVDVGANIGLSALGLAKAGIHVIAFEPVEENIRLLERSVIENAVLHRLHLQPYALGIENRASTIYVPVNADNASMSRDIAIINMNDKKCGTEAVDVCRFDDISHKLLENIMVGGQQRSGSPERKPAASLTSLSLIRRIRMVKIDVQGYELDVLRGMQRFLEEECLRGTSILVELDPKLLAPRGVTPENIIMLMERWGFSCHNSISSLDKIFLKR